MHNSNPFRPAQVLLTALFFACGAQAAGAAVAASTSISQGNKLWEQGKHEQAQKRFEEALAADPKSIDAHMKLAGIQITRQYFSSAVQTYRNVLAIDPKNAKAWMGMGLCYMHTGAKELAKAAFEEALRIEPNRKEQIAPVLAQIDERLETRRAQIEATMPNDINHKGKPTQPAQKTPAKASSTAK